MEWKRFDFEREVIFFLLRKFGALVPGKINVSKLIKFKLSFAAGGESKKKLPEEMFSQNFIVEQFIISTVKSFKFAKSERIH